MRGWVNVDIQPGPGVDVVTDLEEKLPWEDETVEEVLCVHTIEHIHNVKPFMQELHRVCKADARAVFKVPYGTSDDADADPDHVRRYLWSSWGYYGQPHYWRTSDPYRGDWDIENVILLFHERFRGLPVAVLEEAVRSERNCVMEMIAYLQPVKPIRKQLQELQKKVPLQYKIGVPA
jgi:SAM-dependent methyltransferase